MMLGEVEGTERGNGTPCEGAGKEYAYKKVKIFVPPLVPPNSLNIIS